MAKTKFACSNCGSATVLETLSHRYVESGVPNVVLQNVRGAVCPACGNEDLLLPHLERIHQAIASALLKSPARLTGPQLRFLRKYVQKTGEEFARYLRTDKTKISKWEQGVDPIGPANDRLIRMLVAALAPELSCSVQEVAEHLRDISYSSGRSVELHIDAQTLLPSYLVVRNAA